MQEMQVSDALRAFWPVFAAGPLFLGLGFWWRFHAAAAMEKSPKPYSWVRQYRTGGFPFLKKWMGSPKLHVWALLCVMAAAGGLFVARLACMGSAGSGEGGSLFAGTGWILPLCMCVMGTGAVYCLLCILFDRLWVSLPAALLFAAAAIRSDGANAMLAVSLLLLLLYLRTERSGFTGELLYLAAILAFAPAVALQPAYLWLLPCFPPVHCRKLLHQLRSRKLSGTGMILFPLLGLALFALCAALGAVLRPLLTGEKPLSEAAALIPALRDLAWEALNCFSFPTLAGAVDLLIDAPLLGFGFWGCCSAWILARKRRNIRGSTALAVLAVQLLLWLLTWRCVPILGLTLTTACVLRDADLGGKRLTALLCPLAGLVWYCFIHLAAWLLPLSAELLERLQ